MYKQLNAATTQGRRRRIVIDEVNLAQHYVSGKDQYGLTFQITFSFHEPGIITIPRQGERWIIEQYKQEWRLKYKVEDLSQVSLNPGDKYIDTNSLVVALEAGGSLTVLDSSGFPLFQITEDGHYHIRTGATLQADL